MHFLLFAILDSKKIQLPEGTRIINGEVVQNAYEKHPWFASIIPENKQNFPFCGASLINRWTAVTACHCFAESPITPDKMLLLHGAYDMNNANELRRAKKIRLKAQCHPEYENESKIHDIALVHLSEPIDIKNYIKLDYFGVKNDLFHPVTALGFGKTDPNLDDFAPTNLRKVNLELVSNPICRWHFKNFLNVTLQHELNTRARKKYGLKGDTCQGDSGGPLIYQDCEDTLVGITSFGYDCGLPYLAGIYTSVKSYIEFINQNIQKDSRSRTINSNQSKQPNLLDFFNIANYLH